MLDLGSGNDRLDVVQTPAPDPNQPGLQDRVALDVRVEGDTAVPELAAGG